MKLNKMKESVQRFGRSLLLPIGVMAPIGMIMGISGALGQDYMIEKLPFLGNPIVQNIINSLRDISSIVFDNIPLLFAMGVAYGMSKNEKGIAVFSSVLGYLTLLIVMNVYLNVTGTIETDPNKMSQAGQGEVLGITTLRLDAFGGILSGLIAAKTTDRFYKLQLPLALAFFGGKKSVAIITFLIMIPIGLVIPIIWGIFTQFLLSISFIFLNSYIGVGVYWFIHQLLIPFGLHHVLASVVRFSEAGGIYMIDGKNYIGILNAVNKILFDSGPSSNEWCKYMSDLTKYLASGQMLITMFRIPAIGLAMYHTAFANNKVIAKGTLITIVLTAFLGNVTEPMEFAFAFISPPLFIVYALLGGIMALPLNFLDISIGYIRGTIFDFGIFGLLYENTNWYQLILLGIVNFVVFYAVFRFAITKFNLKTPGREENLKNTDLLKEKRYTEIADIVIEGLGGQNNIKNVDNCVTRLRIDLYDDNKIDEEKVKDSGSSGLFKAQKNHVHVVFGPHVEFIKNAVDESLD